MIAPLPLTFISPSLAPELLDCLCKEARCLARASKIQCGGRLMEPRHFGPTRRQVAVIGQGTWYNDSDDRTSAAAALRRGLDLGMAHIDTAEMYGDAEQIVA